MPTPEQDTDRADTVRPGDQIHYAGAWHTVRAVVTVTTINAGGMGLDYEPGQELAVRRQPSLREEP